MFLTLELGFPGPHQTAYFPCGANMSDTKRVIHVGNAWICNTRLFHSVYFSNELLELYKYFQRYLQLRLHGNPFLNSDPYKNYCGLQLYDTQTGLRQTFCRGIRARGKQRILPTVDRFMPYKCFFD